MPPPRRGVWRSSWVGVEAAPSRGAPKPWPAPQRRRQALSKTPAAPHPPGPSRSLFPQAPCQLSPCCVLLCVGAWAAPTPSAPLKENRSVDGARRDGRRGGGTSTGGCYEGFRSLSRGGQDGQLVSFLSKFKGRRPTPQFEGHQAGGTPLPVASRPSAGHGAQPGEEGRRLDASHQLNRQSHPETPGVTLDPVSGHLWPRQVDTKPAPTWAPCGDSGPSQRCQGVSQASTMPPGRAKHRAVLAKTELETRDKDCGTRTMVPPSGRHGGAWGLDGGPWPCGVACGLPFVQTESVSCRTPPSLWFQPTRWGMNGPQGPTQTDTEGQ